MPDPHISNPDLFDLEDPHAPIPQYSNACGYLATDVVIRLHTEILIGDNGNINFQAILTNDGIVLMLTKTDIKGNIIWEKATPGNYWHNFGKYIGLYLGGNQTINPYIQKIGRENLNEGILSLNGQVRPGPDIDERKPSNSFLSFQIAQSY